MKEDYLCTFAFVMIYLSNFESKIGFDRIRSLLKEKCLSPMGIEKVDTIRFNDDIESLSEQLSATSEFQQLLQFEENFPSENYYSVSECLNRRNIPGSEGIIRPEEITRDNKINPEFF
jgi:DNA mismatch repair protein MutS2